MPKRSKPTLTSITNRLTLQIKRPPKEVWRILTTEAGLWWPADFHATPEPHRMVFEAKLGGRLMEDNGEGNGLVWYQVIALDAPRSILLFGQIAPPFGGPATSLLRLEFSASGKNFTTFDLTDSVFGLLTEPATTEEGWRQLFEGGLKKYCEGKQ